MVHRCTSQCKVLVFPGRLLVPAVIVMALLVALTGCGPRQTHSSYAREQVDLNYIKKVAVLPFTNNTMDEYAANRLRDITSTQILTMGIFDVVDSGIVDSALREMAVRENAPLDSPVLKRLGQRLEVQGFIHGTVEDVSTGQQGSFSYPQVSLTLKLIDSESALLLWQASGNRLGYSVWDRLFDLDPQSGYELSETLTRDMLATIPK